MEVVFIFYCSITNYRYLSNTHYLAVSWLRSLDIAELGPLLRVWQGSKVWCGWATFSLEAPLGKELLSGSRRLLAEFIFL